jgi:ParB family transcriptional regulator, chromosome partitioning protein
MSKVTGLGQGVSLLFGNQEEDERFFECEVEKILPNKHQPRTHFNPDELLELANSIRENGIIQPLIVGPAENNGKFPLIAGERRLRASKLAGLRTVPVIVRDFQDENSLLELAIIENVQRTDLNPIEEAEAYNKLIERFGYTQDETAKKVGKKRTTITNMLRLLNLPVFLKDDVVTEALSEGHARALLRLNNDPLAQKEIRDTAIKNKLSVRQTEKLIRKVVVHPKTASSREETTELSPSYIAALTNQLVNKLHTNVRILQNSSQGKIEIHYYSTDDLERLISALINQPPRDTLSLIE